MDYYSGTNNCACTTVWSYWVTYTAATTTTDPWAGWANATNAWHRPSTVPPRRVETAEEIAARQTREREYQARLDAQRAERLAAERKAEVLLLRHLSAAQREEYQRTGAFTVRMPDGRSYRIKKGWSGNVEHFEAPRISAQVLERDGAALVPAANGPPRQIERLCIHPTFEVPHCDNMLAQKLLLESNEPEFRRIANITRTG